MNRFILFLPTIVFALIVSSGTLAQPANTELSKGFIFEGEPFIGMNPTNPQNIVVAWMSFKLIGNPVTIETRATFDGGMTWTDTILLPHQNPAWQSADVSMAWRNDGVLFLSYIDYLDSSNTDGGVYVVSSIDGGRSFSVPVQALDATEDTDVSLDRPWIAVDNSTTNGNLYICTKPAPWNPLPNHTYLTLSTDGGQDWSHEAVVDSGAYAATLVPAPMGSPTVAMNGELSIAYPFYSGGLSAGYALAQSRNGGVSFSRSLILVPIENAKEKDSIKGGFHIIADPTNSNHLIFAWPDGRNGDYDAFASTSFDNGATWSTPARVNDDPIGNGVVQDMVWPTFGPDGGLAIVWRDRRNGSSPGYASASDTYCAFSMDSGRTWSKNVRLSDSTAPYNPGLERPGNDFLSASIQHDTLYAAWSDFRTNALKVYFANVPLPTSSASVTMIGNSTAMGLTVHPNPVENTATIAFTISSIAHCSLTIYNEMGIAVAQLADGEFSAGMHSVPCTLNDLANGNYFVELETPDGTARATLKVVKE